MAIRTGKSTSKKAPFPLALTERLVVEDLDGETLVYDLNRHHAHCLNRTAARLWRLCNGRRSTPDLTEQLSDFAGPGLDQHHVSDALRKLRAANLVEMPREPQPDQSVRRRAALTRLVRLGGSLASLPTIISIVAPTAAQAASCLSQGADCTSSAQCCPSGSPPVQCCRQGKCRDTIGGGCV